MRKMGMMHGSGLAMASMLVSAALSAPPAEIASAGRHRGREPQTKKARQQGTTSALNNQRL